MGNNNSNLSNCTFAVCFLFIMAIRFFKDEKLNGADKLNWEIPITFNNNRWYSVLFSPHSNTLLSVINSRLILIALRINHANGLYQFKTHNNSANKISILCLCF